VWPRSGRRVVGASPGGVVTRWVPRGGVLGVVAPSNHPMVAPGVVAGTGARRAGGGAAGVAVTRSPRAGWRVPCWLRGCDRLAGRAARPARRCGCLVACGRLGWFYGDGTWCAATAPNPACLRAAGAHQGVAHRVGARRRHDGVPRRRRRGRRGCALQQRLRRAERVRFTAPRRGTGARPGHATGAAGCSTTQPHCPSTRPGLQRRSTRRFRATATAP
jgi:hypothetical protein